MLYVILIVLLIISWSGKSALEKENHALRQMIETLLSQFNQMQNMQIPVQQPIYQTPMAQEPIYQPQPEVVSEVVKSKMSDEEKKNVTILITGSLFIVLAAVVFLMSTWYTIPSLLKSTVLVLLTVVFFGCSYLAEHKFKLEKVANTFFYIAYAYIPICLLSISLFGLLGEYLSIGGDGEYIYLSFASIIVAGIYYFTYKAKDNIYLLRGSILSQILTIVLFSLIFADNLALIITNLLLYNILLICLTKSEIFKKIYTNMPLVLAALTVSIFSVSGIFVVSALALFAITFLILESKESNKLNSYLFNIFLMVFGLYTISQYGDLLSTEMLYTSLLGYALSIYILENVLLFRSDKIHMRESLALVTLLVVAGLHVGSFNPDIMISPYIISLIQIGILTVTFKIINNNDAKKLVGLMIVVYLIMTEISFISEMRLPYYTYTLFAFITFILGELIKKKEEILHKSFFILSHIFVIATYLFMFIVEPKDSMTNIGYSLLLLGFYGCNYYIAEKSVFKNAVYLTSNYFLFTLIYAVFGESEALLIIPMTSTLVIMFTEFFIPKFRDTTSDVYISISQILSFLLIFNMSYTVGTIVGIAYGIGLIAYNLTIDKGNKWSIIPLLGLMPAIFYGDFDSLLSLTIMTSITLLLAIISAHKGEKTVFTIFSGIYLLMTMRYIENSYLAGLLLAMWAGVHIVKMNNPKVRDFFRFILYVSGLIIYQSIITDLALTEVTAVAMFGYIVVAVLTLKNIFKKYMSDLDTVEYITFATIYLGAFSMYANEVDGMVFGCLVIGIIIFSYMFKYGAIFITSIFSIIINVLLLTREFWFSVPWWIYLLGIGSILITFAVRNEIRSKNTTNVRQVLKNIKENVDGKKEI